MEPEKKIGNIEVKTYAEDMAEVLENDKEGLVRKIIHGAKEKEAEKKNLSPESKQNKIFLIVSIALLTLGLVTLSFFLINKDIKTVPVEKQFVPIIFNDRTSFIEVLEFKKEEIEQTVLNQANSTTIKKNGVEGIFLTLNNQKVGLREFLSLIKSNFVPNESEVLVSDDFLMGIVNVEGINEKSYNRPGFFILMRVRSIADIFDAMRAWESKMFFDLHGFFGFELGSESTYLLTKNFEDGIVENKNTRFLYDKNNNLVLMYVFADDNSVIITNSQDAVHEIVLRLASKKTKQ